MKKTILHIIDNLSRGGAETMLVAVTKNLPDYHNIIVTLNEVNEFEEGEVKCDELITQICTAGRHKTACYHKRKKG